MAATDQAIAAIGSNEPGDYALEPTQHADRLPPSAGTLKRVLQEPSVVAAVAGYETFDREAGRSQTRYKGICRRTLFALGTVAVAGVAAAVIPWPEPFDTYARVVAVVLVYTVLIYSFISLRVLARANPYKRWHQQRANAEALRGQLFKTVMQASPVGSQREGEIDLLPLKLEYFRRYHLDVQQAYYTFRAQQHERHLKKADGWRRLGAGAILAWIVFALLAAITPLVEPLSFFAPAQNLFRWFEWVETTYLDAILLTAGLCVMVGYGLALANSSISNDLRNAGRYAAYALKVAAFYEKLPAIRALATDPANTAEVTAFAAEVQELFDSEHRDWKLMQELEGRGSAAPPQPRFSWAKMLPFRRQSQGSIS